MSRNVRIETLDFDAVWAAISRSSKLRAALTAVAQDVASEAAGYAQQVAYDDGYYKDSFETGTMKTQRARTIFLTRARRRRGTQKSNRFLDASSGDPDGGAYDGHIAIVVNTNFKARWVEWGTLAKGPRLVMTTVAERIAGRSRGLGFEVLYGKTHEQNLPALGAKISAAKQGRGTGR